MNDDKVKDRLNEAKGETRKGIAASFSTRDRVLKGRRLICQSRHVLHVVTQPKEA
jgi:hypothetical protein